MDLLMQERIAPVSPTIMTLREVGLKYAMEKNEMWHSRLPITSHSNMVRSAHKVFYGAEYKDHCFAIAMWTDPVANNRMSKDHIRLELRRLAVAPDAPKFAATWMISKMIKDIKKRFPDITMLVSYQDTEVHTGTIYKAANWKLDAVSKYKDWSTGKRQRNVAQTKADKIRWIFEIRQKDIQR
jgi:hypothetical protein